MNTAETPLEPLFTEGGPGARMMHRLRLLHRDREVASWRAAITLAILSWLPLLVMTALEGLLVGGSKIPFVKDIAAHARFLLAVPLLVLADIPVGFRLREMVRQFLRSGLIREPDRVRFEQILVDAVALRDSRLAEIVVVAGAYITTFLIFTHGQLQLGSTWYTPDATNHLSLAGYWYVMVSLPIFQFLVFRWLYRMFNWALFLWKVSRLDLRLSAAHPDAAGGLGFLGKSLVPFGTISFALSTVVSGAIASRVLFAGAQLEPFAFVIGALLVVTLLMFAGPLVIFTPKLFDLKYQGMLKYGVLADRYTRLFEQKWIELGDLAEADEALLGSGDIQSLADLGNSFELVRKMRVFPVERSDFIALAIPAILPALPLSLTVMPFTEIIKDLLHLIA